MAPTPIPTVAPTKEPLATPPILDWGPPSRRGSWRLAYHQLRISLGFTISAATWRNGKMPVEPETMRVVFAGAATLMGKTRPHASWILLLFAHMRGTIWDFAAVGEYVP